ncbi:uncharacterized protein LOC132715943 [Ruditapes philippinarum]|uniref:uncharacterized protein LOC132715943 n=1 Tax=Ruditapes philippinarum TaxID=129788 RepID=UPI00295A7A27|nr:uncharacterized protein LOC132715943 [Ruditapes philippinarum]
MPTKRHRLPHTFPHKIVFIISLVLCMCACGGIVNAVVAWSNYLWGYYLGTGFWSGAVMLLAGMFGIVASYVRSICAVKTFMIISIFGCITSLGMIALASGGLDARSGFYHGYNQTTFMTSVIHAVYLGLGVLQLSLGVLSDGICIYYLFIGHSAEIYCVKSDGKIKQSKKGSYIRRNGKERSSTGSQAPLVGESRQSKRSSVDKDTMSNRRSQSIGENSDVAEFFPIPYTASGTLNRQALLRQELLLSKVTPLKTPCTRSASFSTFGRIGRPHRESLIDDNASISGTGATNPPRSPDDECHYAQTMLFGPPVPIEQDEILPPYEIVDTSLVRSKPKRRGLKRPKSEDLHKHSRGRNNSSEREKRGSSKRGKITQVKSKIPATEKETQSEHGSLRKRPPKQESNAFDQNMVRLSRSADLLSFDEEIKNKRTCYDINGSQGRGIESRNLSNSGDMILVMDQQVLLRHKRPQSQTVRSDRDRRIERRRKALSAEFKPNKDQNMFIGRIGLDNRSDSIDGSNSSLYAGKRIRSTKFSLRQPVRQIGMPHVCSPVPVKPLVHVPKVGPPPKPPRNFSVKAEDLKDLNMDEEVDTIFADINGLNNVENNDDVFDTKDIDITNVAEEKPLLVTESRPVEGAVLNFPQSHLTDKVLQSSNRVTLNTSSVPLSPEVKLDSGPVLKFVPPKREPKEVIDTNVHSDKSESVVKTEDVHSVRQLSDTMTLPSSPIMRPPPVAFSKSNDKTRTNVDKGNVTENISKDNYTKAPLKFNFVKENNNAEVVYAKVLKEKPQSPVSPVSSISPTSPSAKVLKAKRLTYTFKDRDVSVFDPIGNSKESEETVESTERISIQYPVEKPKGTENVNKQFGQLTNERSNGNISSQPTVILRQPPLSPSERILQRKTNTIQNQSNLSPSKEDRPVIIQPTNTFIIDLTNTASGARPKTNNGFSSNFMPPQQFHASKIDTNPKETRRPVSNPVVLSNVRESPQKEIIRRQMSQGTATKSALPPILPKPQQIKTNNNNRQTAGASSDSSAKFVPAVSSATVSTTGVARGTDLSRFQGVPLSQHQTSNSQGVLHLPQSQSSRQVADTVPPPIQAMNGQHGMAAAAVVQNVDMRRNNDPQNNDDQADKPLFSMVL